MMRRARNRLVKAAVLSTVAVGCVVASSSSVAYASAIGTISVGSGAVVEGTSGGLQISFPVTLSAPASSTVTVAYATAAGSATAGKDYTAKQGTLKFVPSVKTGQSPVELTVTVPILHDPAADGTETFSVNLSAPTGGYVLANASGTGTIYDEASGVTGIQANIGDASVYEGYSGPNRTEAIPVTLSAASATPVSVDWVFVGGSALWGTDYTGTQYGTITFAPGQRTILLPIKVIPDGDVGADTYIAVQIENPVGATIGRADGTETISDGGGGTADLSISNALPAQIWEHTPFVYPLTITNQGTGGVPDIYVNASPDPALTVTPGLIPGWSCGNLGGLHVPHSGWYCDGSNTTLLPGQSLTLDLNMSPGSSGTYAEQVTVSTSVAQLNNVPHTFNDTISVGTPPVPSVPQNLQVAQSGPNLDVVWSSPATGQSSVLKSTVTATPQGGSPITTVVPGSATSAAFVNVQPSTTYTVTVASTSYSGTGPAATTTITTQAPTVPPGAPQSVTAGWTSVDSPSYLAVQWGTTNPGNSPIDSFEIEAVPASGTTLDSVIPAPASSYTFPSADNSQSWTVTVRAHNAAGWGAWSTPVGVPALDS